MATSESAWHRAQGSEEPIEMRETNCLNIFLKMVDSVRNGVRMNSRSANKEYFAQDWFADRLADAGVESLPAACVFLAK